MKLGATAAIVKNGNVLLALREDFEVWCLPGGLIDPGESLAETAIREAKEETGLDISITRLVGAYSEIGDWADFHILCYAAQAIGGTLTPQPAEILELAYFAPDALPTNLFWWHKQQIVDLFAGIGGSSSWRQEIPTRQQFPSRAAAYRFRDESGLSRLEFYRWQYESRPFGNIQRQDIPKNCQGEPLDPK